MTSSPNNPLRPVAMSVLTFRAGPSADATSVAGAVGRAYDDLAGVLVSLIGQVGLDALTARASHLSRQEYAWGQTGDTAAARPFDHVTVWLAQQDAVVAIDGGAAMLSNLGALMVAFIGEPLTMRILRKAWPEGFPDSDSEEIAT